MTDRRAPLCNLSLSSTGLTRRGLGLAALGAGVAAAVPGWAAEPVLIRELLFPSTTNLLSWVAKPSEAYAARGLRLETKEALRSVDLIKALLSGEANVGASTFDNVVAYNEGQGDASALSAPADLVCVMGLVDSISVPLIARGELRAVEQLRGKKIAVDAPSTGFAFLTRALLQSAGLSEGDYELVRVGAARQRLHALRKGEADAAILTTPFDALALRDGFRRVDESGRLYPRFQSNCIITTRRWANANRRTLVDFIKAKLDAYAWIADPAHLGEAAEILKAHNQDLDEAGARSAVLDLKRAFKPEISLASVRPVLELRARYAKPPRRLRDPRAYMDLSFYRQARRERRS